MKAVRLTGLKVGADKHQIGILQEARFAVPIMRFARKLLDFRFTEGNEAPGWNGSHADKVLVRRVRSQGQWQGRWRGGW